MQFQEILDRFLVMTYGSGERVTYYNPEEVDNENHIVVEWGSYDNPSVRFDGTTEVTFDAHGEEFHVVSTKGISYGFRAYSIVKFNTTDHPRAIKLEDAQVEQAEPNRLELKVGKFDIRINHTDEGVVVDIWPWQEPNSATDVPEPLATCYAFDSDADDALSGE